MDFIKRWIVAIGSSIGVAIILPMVSLAEETENRLGSMFAKSDAISFVAGLSGGANFLSGRFTEDLSDSLAFVGAPYIIKPAKHDLGKTTPLFGAFLGVHMALDEKMFMGLELSGDFSKPKTSHILVSYPGAGGNSLSSRVTRENAYAATLLFGVKVGETTDIYIRAGAVMTKIKAQSVVTLYGALPNSETIIFKRSNSKTNFLAGIGLRGHLNENLAVRLEYNYSKMKLPATTETIVTPTAAPLAMTRYEKGDFTNQAVIVSVEYKF